MTHAVPLDHDTQRALTFQTYPPAADIEGVRLQPLTKHRGENGWFLEHLRLTAGRVVNLPGEFELRQMSVSYAAPQRINAFHVHPKLVQNELWTVISGQLLVWLVDCRAGSPTLQGTRRVLLTAEDPALLYIPAGVAHGYRAGRDGALLLYAMDQQFNADDPNEGRLPWDYFGRELWEEDRG